MNGIVESLWPLLIIVPGVAVLEVWGRRVGRLGLARAWACIDDGGSQTFTGLTMVVGCVVGVAYYPRRESYIIPLVVAIGLLGFGIQGIKRSGLSETDEAERDE